jgi:Putative peptidoglycan binding domain
MFKHARLAFRRLYSGSVPALAGVIAFALLLDAAPRQVAAASNEQILGGIGVGIAAGILLNDLSKGAAGLKKHVVVPKARTNPTRAIAPARAAPAKAPATYVLKAPQSPKDPPGGTPTPSVTPAATDVAKDRSPLPQEDAATPVVLTTENGATGMISTPDEILAAQQHLKSLGYDVLEPNGQIDARTKGAILLFQESIKAPITGELSREQLMLLFQKVAQQNQPSQ